MMKVSNSRIGFIILLLQLIVSLHASLAAGSATAPAKRSGSKVELEEDAVVKALEKGFFARRSASSQPPGVWGRSIEKSFQARDLKSDGHVFRPQSPAERRALQSSIEHLLKAKEALDTLNKRAAQPPGVWGKRIVAQPPGVWGKRNVRTQPPGVWGKRNVRTQPPGVWGKRAMEFMERGYALGEEERSDEETIENRSEADVRQPAWVRKSMELSHTDDQ